MSYWNMINGINLTISNTYKDKHLKELTQAMKTEFMHNFCVSILLLGWWQDFDEDSTTLSNKMKTKDLLYHKILNKGLKHTQR